MQSKYRFLSEMQLKRASNQRMFFVHCALLLVLLVIVSRLLELQILQGSDYRALAESQHYGGVVLPAKRGEILSRNSKTGETSIFATNTTLDMVYVDPLITDDPGKIADALAELLVTEQFHELCLAGDVECPVELAPFYSAAFDPQTQVGNLQSGALLEPLGEDFPPPESGTLPGLLDVRSQFAEDIRERISEKRVTFVPLVYGATKLQMQLVENLDIQGIYVVRNTKIIFANPEEIEQLRISDTADQLQDIVEMDDEVIKRLLRSRPLRYVPVMRRLSPDMGLKVRELKLRSLRETAKRKSESATREEAQNIQDPFRCVALIAEHWRYYPDGRVGSHVVGFLNSLQEAQYGIERTFDLELRGQEGLISSVSDPQGGQILTADQTIIDPKDGDTIVLSIDRFVQKKVEEIMDEAVKSFRAESGQAIVMDPFTGRIIAMVNAPTFDSNNYGVVYEKEPWYLDEKRQNEVVAEIYHPVTNQFVVKAYLDDIFTLEGRERLTEKTRESLAEIEELYDLRDITRYYLYIGENTRREIFPTERNDIWLKYRNGIGVGAYLNRTIQQIYEPGSVFKPITMSIAIDQGEVTPEDKYVDKGSVSVDEYTIKNALEAVYGEVSMTYCLQYSINTCMTSVSMKLGQKLFHRMIERFGFSRITSIELEDELPGEILPWRQWSQALLATSAYGQGISATPLQVITGWAALANGGRLMKPTIIDSIIRSDGSVVETKPQVVDQVITPESSETITAMLTMAVRDGWAKAAAVPGYRIAGKTGTSQIAGPGGKYEAGTGSTIASFAGFGPVPNPRFIVLIKFDRPGIKAAEHGAGSAAPVFKKIAIFLFDYYGVPPGQEQ